MRDSVLRQQLLAWYDLHHRTLPWRSNDPDPYAVMVSELMLQQTTVETVRPRFRDFIERFPTISILARSPLDDVLHAWQGLGYYRRARSLHAAAQIVDRDFDGQMPHQLDQLLSLPGVGRYTAFAIAAIAFNAPVVPVDGNIARIVSRLFSIDEIWPVRFDAFQNEAERFADDARSGDVAQALMDLGATICRPKRPQCLLCPLAGACSASKAGRPEDYPKKAAKKTKRLLHSVAFVARTSKRIQLRQRPETGLLAGMIELPSTDWLDQPLHNRPLDDWLAHAPAGIECIELLGQSVRHVFTHIDLRIDLAVVRSGQAENGFWHDLDRLGELALPTMTRKLLKAAGVEV